MPRFYLRSLTDRRGKLRNTGQREVEAGSLARLRLRPDPAAVQFHDAAADRETKSRAGDRRAVQPRERFEYRFAASWLKPEPSSRTVIRHRLLTLRAEMVIDGAAPFRRVLNGIRDQLLE